MSSSATSPRFSRLAQPLLADCPPLIAYAIALAAGLAMVWRLFPAAFLAGHGQMFDIGDAAQHVSGWWFYVKDDWHLPLLHTRRLAYPEGVSIAFTDSIPLAALLFKPFAAWLPPHFHYVGLWHAVVFVTQALAAVFLIRGLGARHAWAALVASVFALTSPALLFRLGHTSLMTHAVVLLALALYVRGRSGECSRRWTLAGFLAVNLAALLLHPYLLAMAFAMLTAWLLDDALARKPAGLVGAAGEDTASQVSRFQPRRLATSLAILLASVGLVVAAALAVGYGNGSTTAVGYGVYSMNLAAPFCGGRFLDCVPTALANQPLAAYHFVDATTGQYEGFNYLGLGLALILLVAIPLHGRSLLRLPRSVPVLTVILLAMAVYALSNRIFWQQTELLTIDLPAGLRRLGDTFRASGRFFWPMGYAVLFLGLAALLRRHSPWALAVVAVAMTLQWVDTGPLRARIQQMAAEAPVDDVSAWSGLMGQVERIDMFPAYDCDRTPPAIYLHWQRLAGYYGKTIDTGYISRPPSACQAHALKFDAPPARGAMYVTAASRVLDMPAGFVDAARRGQCVQVDQVVACTPDIAAAVTLPPGAQPVSVLPLTDRIEWTAAQLPSLVGELRDGALVPRDPATAGYLSFGPYVELPPAAFRVALSYASQAPAGQPVGRWDIVLGQSVLAEGTLLGTAGAAGMVGQDISLAGLPRGPLEVRTYFSANGDLRLQKLAISRGKAR